MTQCSILMKSDDLGVDAYRVAAGGRSAGGHLAAATASYPGFVFSRLNQSLWKMPFLYTEVTPKYVE